MNITKYSYKMVLAKNAPSIQDNKVSMNVKLIFVLLMKGLLYLDIVYLVNLIPENQLKIHVLLNNVDQTKSFYPTDNVKHVNNLQEKLVGRNAQEITAK